MRRALLVCLYMMVVALPAFGQTVESYELGFYNVGAPSPISTYAFAEVTVTCGLPAPPAGSTVNPTRVLWDDPAGGGLMCEHTFVAGSTIFALPIPGSYEGVLVAINEAGASPGSTRAPFDMLAALGARSGLRFTR